MKSHYSLFVFQTISEQNLRDEEPASVSEERKFVQISLSLFFSLFFFLFLIIRDASEIQEARLQKSFCIIMARGPRDI